MQGKRIIYKPIGIIYSPFHTIEGVPVQPAGAEGIRGKVKIYSRYAEGLKSLDGFSHVILIYHFHLSKGYYLKVEPFLGNSVHGVFATRAPNRPNHIGISVVKIEKIKDNIVDVINVDIVDGTPLLDIKPYVSFFDSVEDEKIGWLSEKVKNVKGTKSDNRFK
jgi:tRNA-Thr(GGU) m(6)t(6)A37 methyltransferase TsaA